MGMSMEDARKDRKGAGKGVVLFSASLEPIWIGVGVVLGVALGFSKTEK